MRCCGYQLVFPACTRSASENNTFSNMPGCIASASQTTICPLLRGQSHTVPLHCIMGKLPQGGGVGGGLAASATWWWCKHECARGQRQLRRVKCLRHRWVKLKTYPRRGLCFLAAMEKMKTMHLVAHFVLPQWQTIKEKQTRRLCIRRKNIQLRGQGKVSLNMNFKQLVNETLESLRLCVCVLSTQLFFFFFSPHTLDHKI